MSRKHAPSRPVPIIPEKEWLDTVPELDLLWKYLVTAQFGRHGIEMNIGSLAGVGSTSSVVISRGVERYVTEFSFGDTEAMYVDTSTLGTGQLAAFLP